MNDSVRWVVALVTNVVIILAGVIIFRFGGLVRPGVSNAYVGYAVGGGVVAAIISLIFLGPVFRRRIGGRMWIFIFLLLGLPSGLLLGFWGSHVKATMKHQVLAKVHLEEHLNEYLSEHGDEETVPEPYIKGKVVIVDVGAQDFSDLQFELPSALMPTDAGEVGSVVQVRFEQKQVGKYDNGATAMQWFANVSVFDIKSHEKTGFLTVAGSQPPSTTKNSGSDSGSKPDKDVVAQLVSLPQKPN